MFPDDKSIKYKNTNHHVNLLSSTLKRNIIEQAASMLLQHVTFHKNIYHITQNSNGNAFDEHHLSLNHSKQTKKEFRRTNKCNLWLSKFPRKSDTSVNRSPVFIESPLYTYKSRDYSPSIHFYPQIDHSNFSMNESHYTPSRFHQNPLILSSNAISNTNNNINPPFESFSQPLMMIHKKRLHRDYFLSTIQNCIQPPYSQNHFYAFDQINMLKLQRNLHLINHEKNYFNSKRKYPEVYDDNKPEYIDSDTQFDRTSPSKKHIASPIEQSSPKTADYNYYDEPKSSLISDEKLENQKSEQSNIILSHLEKILNLCGELRTLAKDVENHLNEESTLKINSQNQIKKSESEQTIIDIYKELENEQKLIDINEKNAPPPYQSTNDTSSIHSETNKSHQLMETESFKTKSPNLTTSHTTLRKSEDICLCFLKSFLEKQNCELNPNEQEYLNELTKAYLLGREQILKEQQEENNKFQAFVNENLPEEYDPSSLIYDTNNNNQSTTSVSPSSILFYNNFQKSDDHLSSIPAKSNDSTISLIQDEQQQSSIPSGVISIKHQIFINEPIAMKTTNVLPGIGIKYAQQLAECGFSTVRRLLGFYLMIKDDQHFVNWLNNKAGISIHSAWLCTNALRAWCQVHL